MSRRTRRRVEHARREADDRPRREADDRPGREVEPEPERTPGGPLSRLRVQLIFLAAVFAVAVGVAELFGAANLGVAFGVGQIAFAAAVVYLILRR
jgi:hypothetical protein